jgi:copper chaperone CopZ
MTRFFLKCLCFLMLALPAQAQWVSAKLNIVGLTCSACSFGTERSLRQLKFVQDVKMDLNSNLADITFKPGEVVSVEQLIQKVYDAGFSVGKAVLVYHFTSEVAAGKSWKSGEDTYTLLNTEATELKGDKSFTFVGEKYMSKKDFKKWKASVSSDKASESGNKSGHHYFVLA